MTPFLTSEFASVIFGYVPFFALGSLRQLCFTLQRVRNPFCDAQHTLDPLLGSSHKLSASDMALQLVLVALLSFSVSCTCLVCHFLFPSVRLYNVNAAPAPIAWPIAKLLDHVLGVNEAHTYKKAELKSFLQFHRTGEEPLRDDEISILNGVLELNAKNVETIMTPIKVRYMWPLQSYRQSLIPS